MRRLHRDRRRYGVVSLLLFLSGAIEAHGLSENMPFLVLETIAGLAMVLVFGGFFLGLGAALPKWRHAFVPMAFTLFVAACLGQMFPQSAFSLLTLTESGTRGLTGMCVAGIFVHFLFYGQWSDGVFRKRRARSATRVVTNLSAESVWYGIMPTPGRRECLHDANIVSVDYTNRERTEVRVLEWAPPAEKVETTLTIDEIKPGSFCVYRFKSPGEHPGQINTGLRALRVVDMGETQVIYVTEFLQNQPLRQILFDWLDDSLGRREDARMAALEEAHARMGPNRSLSLSNLRIGGVLNTPRGAKSAARGALLEGPAPLHLAARSSRKDSRPDSRQSMGYSMAGE
ncbi:MAG: hypothetical protein ACRBCL_10400 [Maritimibacter sp.]